MLRSFAKLKQFLKREEISQGYTGRMVKAKKKDL
ncbi:hypothetical protein HID58_037467 [Brassica napus]|uniref:Uncharacterized protein n=1 Tax=Brassica napus TaxID=3708 RepID=A0ABQ8BLF5_BRANA|nr:hypothetical protein HID58_037467 [Brassica napus]